MDYKKILMGVVNVTHKNGQNGEIAKLLENGTDGSEQDIIKKILEEDVKRVQAIKESVDNSGKFQEGYAKGKKETLTEFEENLKQKYKVETDKQGIDLVDEVLNTKIEAVKDKNKITDDLVKAHPVFQQMETKFINEKKELEKGYKQQIQDLQKDFEYKNVLNDVHNNALNIFESLNPILPENKVVAQNQKKWFLKSLEDFEYKNVDGKIVVLKDGKVVEDEHGNTKSFDELVKENAGNFFEFKKNNGGGNEGGNPNKGGNPNQSVNVDFKAMNREDASTKIYQIMNDDNIPFDTRMEAQKQYDEVFG